MSYTRPPLQLPLKYRRKSESLSDDPSSPQPSSWYTESHAHSPLSSSPACSSPPVSPYFAKSHSIARILSSPPVHSEHDFNQSLDISDEFGSLWRRGSRWTGSVKSPTTSYRLPSFRSSFPSDDELPPISDGDASEFSEDAYSPRIPPSTLSRIESVFYSDSEDDQDLDDETVYPSIDIRHTCFSTSAERGRWRYDPIPFQPRLCSSAPTTSLAPKLSVVPRPISEPAPYRHPEDDDLLPKPSIDDFLSHSNSEGRSADVTTSDTESPTFPPLSSDLPAESEADDLIHSLPLPPSSPPISPMSLSSVSPMLGPVSPMSLLPSSSAMNSPTPLLLPDPVSFGCNPFHYDSSQPGNDTSKAESTLPSEASTVTIEWDEFHGSRSSLAHDQNPADESRDADSLNDVIDISSVPFSEASFSELGTCEDEKQLPTPISIPSDEKEITLLPLSPLTPPATPSEVLQPRLEDESAFDLLNVEMRSSELTSAIDTQMSVKHYTEKAKDGLVQKFTELTDYIGDSAAGSAVNMVVSAEKHEEGDKQTRKPRKRKRVADSMEEPSESMAGPSTKADGNVKERRKLRDRDGSAKKKPRVSASTSDVPATRGPSNDETDVTHAKASRSKSRRDHDELESSSSKDTIANAASSKSRPERADDLDKPNAGRPKAKRPKQTHSLNSVLPSSSSPSQSSRVSVSEPPEPSFLKSAPNPETLALDNEICGLLIESMALSRASSLPVSSLYKLVMQSRPALKAQRTETEWMEVFQRVLHNGESTVGSGVFGKVESSGKDDADRPLEAQWFYVPEKDEDQERATLIQSMMPRPGKRSETKKYKQYYYRPLDKISRWDPEDEI